MEHVRLTETKTPETHVDEDDTDSLIRSIGITGLDGSRFPLYVRDLQLPEPKDEPIYKPRRVMYEAVEGVPIGTFIDEVVEEDMSDSVYMKNADGTYSLKETPVTSVKKAV